MILARIIDQNSFGGVVSAFNDAVVAMAQNRTNTLQDDIIIVNQEAALNSPADMADNLHPNPTGYQKMADVWKFPLSGEGTPTGTGTCDSTGAHTVLDQTV